MAAKDSNFFEAGDKLLIKMIYVLFCLVIFSQALLVYEPFHLRISLLEKLEGEKIEENLIYPAGDINIGTNNLTFRLLTPYISSLPQANILVNGEKNSDFTNLQTTISAEVGDKVTIDITNYSLDLEFKVISSGKIKIPKDVLSVRKGQSLTIIVEKAN